ncbi:hypothetical protein D3C77_350640 [compost metagenome]
MLRINLYKEMIFYEILFINLRADRRAQHHIPAIQLAHAVRLDGEGKRPGAKRSLFTDDQNHQRISVNCCDLSMV